MLLILSALDIYWYSLGTVISLLISGNHASLFTICHPPMLVGWLCWGLTSQSTIFQSCRDGAIASWVINQYFWGVKCLAQGHNTAAVGLEPRTSRSGVRHSTTEPPRSPPTNVNDDSSWNRYLSGDPVIDSRHAWISLSPFPALPKLLSCLLQGVVVHY